MARRTLLAPGLLALAVAALVAVILSGLTSSQAVQNPSLSLDMIPTGNTYSDPGSGGDNSMTVGAVDPCLSTAAPGNNLTHSHSVHVVVRNVEDLIGWQLRLNYDGGKMTPNIFNFAPFTDSLRGQNVSFVNLPIDSSTGNHRDLTTATNIPPSAPGPQTALAASVYLGSQNAAVSPDTPAKPVPDDSSYSAPTGGVVAALNLHVLAGNAGQLLSMDLDDDSPNPPGSKVEVFNGSGSSTINIPEGSLGDGFHDEGGAGCPATSTPTPTSTPGTPTPTGTPSSPTPSLPPSRTPTVTPSLTTTPTPPVDVRVHTFNNSTGQTASDLHARFSFSIIPRLIENAPGCPVPTLGGNHSAGRLDVDWGVACVDDGELVRIEITSEPPATLRCFNWTIFGSPIGSDCDATPTPTQSATPTPTPTPAGHDSRLTRISGVPKSVRLSPGEVIADSGSITVANQSAHQDTIGVYVDVAAPASGGCTPSGRVLQTTVTLNAGAKTTIPVPVSYSCADVAAANGLSYTWVAVADHGGDDLASCPPGSLQGVGCFNALANDDEDPGDNRLSRNGPKVIAQ